MNWTMLQSPVFLLLCLLGVVSLLVFLNRLLDLRRAHANSADFIRGVANVYKPDNREEALAICDETDAPIARIVATAIHHSDGSARVLRETVDAAGRVEVSRLERRLASLAIIAQVAPLLGLLGTIIGMIRVVLALNAEALVSRADLLDGTMHSLVAAAAGLVVGASVQVMYGMLHVRLDRVIAELESGASEILSILSTRREVSEPATH